MSATAGQEGQRLKLSSMGHVGGVSYLEDHPFALTTPLKKHMRKEDPKPPVCSDLSVCLPKQQFLSKNEQVSLLNTLTHRLKVLLFLKGPKPY